MLSSSPAASRANPAPSDADFDKTILLELATRRAERSSFDKWFHDALLPELRAPGQVKL